MDVNRTVRCHNEVWIEHEMITGSRRWTAEFSAPACVLGTRSLTRTAERRSNNEKTGLMSVAVRRVTAVDAAVASSVVVIAIIAVVVGSEENGGGISGPAIGLAVVGSAVLVWRTQFPVLVLAASIAARAVMASGFGGEAALTPAVMVALYTVARSGDRRRALTVAVAGALITAVMAAGVDRNEPFLEELLGEATLALLPVAVGEAVRTRAERLEQIIEAEAQARVQAERLRISRDLHDVVAHGLSTIAVQSGVASHLLDRNPKQAREALDIINATGKESLEQLRAMVGVLRSTDEAPLRPTPIDPDDLSAIIDSAANAGLVIRANVDGTFPDETSEASVVAFHRILQEALTNVSRHAGPVPTRIEIDHGMDTVHLRVVNDRPDPPVQDVLTTGVGIVGMIERAESLGGTLTAAPGPGDQFVVDATIPYHPRQP